MGYCEQCGTEIQRSARYCPGCGAEVAKSNQRAPKQRQQSNSSGEPTGLRACGFVLLFGIAGIAVLMVFGAIWSGLTGTERQMASNASSNTEVTPQGEEDFLRIPKVTRYATNSVNLRSGPGTSYEVLSQLQPGDAVFVAPDSSTSEWAAISVRGVQNDDYIRGYVASDYLQSTPLPDLQLVSHDGESGQYSWSVVGQIRNNTNSTYSYVQVEINLYDSNGNQVGSTMTNINNLEPGRTWNFEAPVLQDEASRYRITDVTGW